MPNGIDMLKKMGLQDMAISPDFANFVRWFGELLSEENYLSEDQILKVSEMDSAGTFVDDCDSVETLIAQTIGKSLNDVNSIDEVQEEYDELRDGEEVLEKMLATVKENEIKIDTELNRLDSESHNFTMKIESLTESCVGDAQRLEELRVKNIENRNSLFTSFSDSQQSSPLRWCRLDLDNYWIDNDNATLSMKLCMVDKLKLMSFIDTTNQNMKRLYSLQNVETLYIRNASAKFETECDIRKVDALIDILSKPFQPMSFSLMREQIERFTGQNEEIEENLENVQATIDDKIAYLGYQEAKLCEVENNKEKLRAAEKRMEILKRISTLTTDNTFLAEMLWLCLHSEMETTKTILENIFAHYGEENKKCGRNLKILTKVSSNPTDDHVAGEFSTKVTEIIADDVAGTKSQSEPLYSSLAKYTEQTNYYGMQLQHAVSASYQMGIVNFIKDFNTMLAQMNAFMGNGPTNKPNIWNLSVLAESEAYKSKFELMFDSFRTMRHNFMEKYHQPFMNDELWKHRQLLWIWFLTDHKKFLEVFEKKSVNRNSRMSLIGGIKRQQ